MGTKIRLLDCTLRDGGYVNDWRFGDETAQRIVEKTMASGVDYVELGFIRHCDYESGKLEFSKMEQVSRLFRHPPPTPAVRAKLAVMVEIGHGYPVSEFPERSESTVDMVRLVVWKRMVKEAAEYARELIAKGYEVSVNLTRSDQYDVAEFAELAHLFSGIGAKAVYIVDTFGLFTGDMVLEYASAADEAFSSGASIGYHAHNNLQQAFSNAVAFCGHQFRHDRMLDASVLGIGRGAGNLCLELIERHLNDKYGHSHDIEPAIECAERWIEPIWHESQWGYSIQYFLSAKYGCNPSYVPLMKELGVSARGMESVFKEMRNGGEGIRYDESLCRKLVAVLGGGGDEIRP